MTEQEIHLQLGTKIFGRKLFCFETIDSTNLFAKSLTTEEFDEGTLVIAERQSAGRGRLGRSWRSESGKNLTFSILLKPKISPEYIGILSIYASLAVAEAIEELVTIGPKCKWPNDV
jgi:BirA family biotin operon repressor/biotin-[acetyl-CoA-carboxylase] ligase